MPTFHLVIDEVVSVDNHQFRVRVWRRADSQPLVLLSQVQGHPPPDWYSSAIANLVVRAFLGFSATIPTFFEVSRWNGADRAVSGQLRLRRLQPAPDPRHPLLHPVETLGRRAALRSQARPTHLKGARSWHASLPS